MQALKAVNEQAPFSAAGSQFELVAARGSHPPRQETPRPHALGPKDPEMVGGGPVALPAPTSAGRVRRLRHPGARETPAQWSIVYDSSVRRRSPTVVPALP